MQFALMTNDLKDNKSLGRRLACRDALLEGLRKLAERVMSFSGGVLLDGTGKMMGSNAHLSFRTCEDLDAWLATEPYVVNQV